MKIIDLIIRGVPAITPVPTAFVVANTVINILTKRAWNFWIALIPAVAVAVAIEGLGFGTMDVAMKIRDYNQSRRQRYNLAKKQIEYRDPHAPVGWAYAVAGIYILIAVTFTVLTDVVPALQKYVFGVLPFLSGLGAMLYALRSDHDRRVETLAKSKEEEKDERRKMKDEKARQKAVKVSEKGGKVSEDTERKPEKPETFGKWKTWRKVPAEEQLKIVRMNVDQVMEVYGVEERTAYNWLEYARRDLGVVGEVAQFQSSVNSDPAALTSQLSVREEV